ncbi:hypothetical protein [uncultured Thiothrix sp.]|uniref:hypothetical protein n=1 Tax=uncultured Thiothrix sp. TaxID=223185 RepID=UPI0026042AB3|nr:hypothetical protein [uncultured Thiothrix sp.]
MRVYLRSLIYVALLSSSVCITTTSFAANGSFFNKNTKPLSSSDLVKLLSSRSENDEPLVGANIEDNIVAAVYPQVIEGQNPVDSLENYLENPTVYRSEGDMRRMVRYFEWVFDAPLINSERNQLRQLLIAQHNKDGGASSKAYQFLAKSVESKMGNVYIDSMDNPFQEEKRADLQKTYLPILKEEASKGEKLAKWLIQHYEAIQIPLTEGDNPLRPQVIKAYIAHMVFCLNEMAGTKPDQPVIQASPEIQLKIAQQLIQAWPALKAEKREELLNLPLTWPVTVQAWPEKSEADKTQARIAWGKEFTPLFPKLLPAHQARLKAYTEAQEQAKAELAKQKMAENEEWANLTAEQQNSELMNDQQMLNQMTSTQILSQVPNQQMNNQFLQNIQESWHHTNMYIDTFNY